MGAPILAEFITGAPAISSQIFSKKDLRCLRIRAYAAIAALGIAVPVTDYSGNLANSSTGLVKVSNDLLGSIPSASFEQAITTMLNIRASLATATTTASSLMSASGIGTLRQCDNHELDVAEMYILALMAQSIGL